MDNLDKYIADTLKCKITEHSNYEYTIINSLKNNKKIKDNVNELLRKVAIVIISITMISGAVFAKQFTVALKNYFETKFSTNYNNYIQILDDNKKAIDDLTIKLDSIIVDDFNIQLVIEYMYKNEISLVDSDILIKDEYDNVIFENNDSKIKGPFSDISVNKVRQNYKNSGNIIGSTENNESTSNYQFTSTYKSTYTRIDKNKIKRVLELYTRENEKFPETKKIYIQIKNFIIKNNSNIIKKIKKECIFEIDLDNKFINRQTTNYIQDETNSKQEFTVLAAESSNMQLKIKMEYTGEKDLKEIINTMDLSSIQIFDEDNNLYINAESLYVLNNKILNISYDNNGISLSDRLLLIINDTIKIPIRKMESSI